MPDTTIRPLIGPPSDLAGRSPVPPRPPGAGYGAVVSDVVVCGYAVRFPLAGMVLAFANYVAGLDRLGHRVVYLEESGWDQSCYHPPTRGYGDDPTWGLDNLAATLTRLGCGDVPIGYVDRASGASWGRPARDRRAVLAGADLLLNVGGVCQLDEFSACDRRVLVDLDPGFTQAGRFGGPTAIDHHAHFSYGTNIGRPGCLVPDDGVAWQPTVPPVIVDWWSDLPAPAAGAALTTVANLDAYGEIEVGGRTWGQKRPEIDRLGDLPSRLTAERGLRLEVAISSGDEALTDELIASGWEVGDGEAATGSLADYRAYVAGSAAEFSVAKEAYVGLRTGWFSDRSACYLAAGRPVVVQDTGFVWPEGTTAPERGVLTWSTADEAAEAIGRVVDEPEANRAAARSVADEVFGHRPVLERLLARIP
jgi:hypothetical protein